MSNSYSIIHNYDNQPLYTPDFQFIQAALNSRQTKLDTNRAKLNSIYSQLEMLKVHRDVDQEYIDNRIKTIHDITDKYAVMDLSNDTFATNLYSNVAQVLDEKVKNAIVSTKLIEAEDAQWKKAKEKGDGSYSETNRAWALANSDRLAYEQNADTGATYKGGAGFVKYIDLGKKMMENIPKMQEMLKAKWIETGPSSGYFQSLDTYEAVDPKKFKEAVDLLLNEEDRRQLRIDAWATYDKQPDEVLKKQWDGYITPKIEEADRHIKSLQSMRQDPKKKDMIAEIDESIAIWEQEKQNYQNNSYDNVVKTSGREGVYTTMYQNQFKDNLTKTYAYEKRLIDRELDQVRAEDVKFQQKLREFEEDARRWELDYTLKLSKEEREREKFEIEYGSGGEGQFTPVDYKEIKPTDVETNVEEYIQEQNNSIKNAKGVLANIVGRNLTNSEFQSVVKQLSPGNVEPDEKAKINIGGKEYTVDMNQHYDVFLGVYNNVINDNPQKQVLNKSMKSVVWQTASDLGKLANKGSGAVYNHLPNYQTKVVKNKKGEFEIVQRQQPGNNYFAYLVKKKGAHDANPDAPSLTESEVKTLEMYTGMSLVMDDEQAEKHSKLAYSFLRDETLRGVKTNGLFLNYKEIRTKGETYKVAGSTKGLSQDKISKKYNNISRVLGEAYKYDDLSDMGFIDTKTAKGGMGDFENRLEKRFKYVDNQLEQTLQGTYALPQVSVQSVKVGSKAHKQLSQMLGLSPDNKNTILMERKIGEDGKFDPSTVTLSYKYTSKSKGVETILTSEPKDVDATLLAKAGIPSFSKAERTPYLASLGESAAVIPMGNNVIDNTKRQLLKSKTGGYLPMDNLNSSFYKKLPEDQAAKVKATVAEYRNGKYIFEVKPLEGNYYHTISKRNREGKLEIVHIDQTPLGDKIYTDEVKTVTKDSYLKNEELFLDYISTQIDNF